MPQYNPETEGLEITGDITINGKAMSKSFFLENAAYVPQEDRLWSALTGNYGTSRRPLHVIWHPRCKDYCANINDRSKLPLNKEGTHFVPGGTEFGYVTRPGPITE